MTSIVTRSIETRPTHRRPLAADEDRGAIAQQPGIAIGVADADGREPARALRAPRRAIPDTGLILDQLGLQDPPFEGRDRPHGVGALRARVSAEERDAGADEIEMEGGAQEGRLRNWQGSPGRQKSRKARRRNARCWAAFCG